MKKIKVNEQSLFSTGNLLQDIPIDQFTGQPKYNVMGAQKVW